MAPGTVNCPLVVSRSAFDKLPADYRSLPVDAKADAYATLIAAYKAADDRNIPLLDETGLEPITYSAELRPAYQAPAAQPVGGAWTAEREAKGPPSPERLDTVLTDGKNAKP